MPATPPTVRDKAPIASRLRVACMRISRRVRFESESQVLPHHFSVLLRLEEGPKTPRELADIEKVSAPSMTRTVAAIVDNGWPDARIGNCSRHPVCWHFTDNIPPKPAAVVEDWDF